MTKNDSEGNFVSHLTELRKRLINSFIFLSVFFVICYYFSEYIYGFKDFRDHMIKIKGKDNINYKEHFKKEKIVETRLF